MPAQTLLDIVKFNKADKLVGVIDESTRAHPELRVLPARTIPGIKYETLVRTSIGSVDGGFRSGNTGVLPVNDVTENRQVETFIAETRVESDCGVADRYVDGAAKYLAMKFQAGLEGRMQGWATQLYYGTSAGNALGYPGCIDVYDTVNMVVDAGGTSASTGSSVWFMRAGLQDVTWVFGENGDGLSSVPAVRRETIIDQANAAKKYDGYVMVSKMYPGVQIGAIKSIGRIKKLTEDNGCGMTDARCNAMLAKFPAGKGPTDIFMNLRSSRQWQTSRTATNPLGTPAPWINQIVGVDGQPINVWVTEALTSVESLTL